jgi:ABC-2 type transport system ATP-binding protein
MIQVEGLTKYYGEYKAIDSLSFHADPGEVVGFLGPNGAGKTTTMRILTGYMPANEGKALIAGYDIFEQSLDARRHIGYLPETVPLYKELTVWQYVDYMASLRGLNAGRADRVDEILDQVGMLDRADSLIEGLSKGMRQRVGLAQALVHKPSVIILDEPTIGLDPRQLQDVRQLIRSIGEHATVLLSTHILEEVKAMCSRILVINKGQIVAEDDPQTLGRRLQGGEGRLLVRVGGDVKPAEVAKALKTVKGVAHATVHGEGVEIVSKKGEDVRAAVTQFIVATKGWDLLESKSMDMSLEDIFLQLTQDDTVEEES